MLAAAVVDIGISVQEFWELTPREFDMLFDRCLDVEERMNRRFGQLCAVVANIVRDAKLKPEPYTIDDFAPKRIAQTRQVVEQKFSPDSLVALLKSAWGKRPGRWGTLGKDPK